MARTKALWAAVSSAADRQRAYRKRQRDGQIVVRLAVSPLILEALLITRRLDDRRSEDRGGISDALSLLLDDWAIEWLKNRDA